MAEVYGVKGTDKIVLADEGVQLSGLELVRRPQEEMEWDGQDWRHVVPATPLRNVEAEQALMWERIKAKRHANLRRGVFVKSVGKWFYTNDESRTQYILLRTMKTLPPDLKWKTMENDFVLMTRELLDEMTTQMVVDEQADFANAERHKAAMLQAENPLKYDYSDGWTANFDEQPAAELEEAAK